MISAFRIVKHLNNNFFVIAAIHVSFCIYFYTCTFTAIRVKRCKLVLVCDNFQKNTHSFKLITLIANL